MNWKTVAGATIAMGVGALGGWWLRTPTAVAPPPVAVASHPAPAVVAAPFQAPPATPVSLPASLPPGTLPPLPPASGVAMTDLAPSIQLPAASAKSHKTPRSGHRIREQARQVPGVRSLAWGDGAQLYVLVEKRAARVVADELCRRFASQAPGLTIMAQETQARSGTIVSIEKRCT